MEVAAHLDNKGVVVSVCQLRFMEDLGYDGTNVAEKKLTRLLSILGYNDDPIGL